MRRVRGPGNYDHSNVHSPGIAVREDVDREIQLLVQPSQQKPSRSRRLTRRMNQNRLEPLVDPFLDEPRKESALLNCYPLVHLLLVPTQTLASRSTTYSHSPVRDRYRIQRPAI